MILASINIESWQAIGAILVLVIAAVGKFIQEIYKAKKDQESNAQQLLALRDIAQSNGHIREGQIAQNGKLELLVEVNQINHGALITENRTTVAALNNLAHALYTTLPAVKKATQKIELENNEQKEEQI